MHLFGCGLSCYKLDINVKTRVIQYQHIKSLSLNKYVSRIHSNSKFKNCIRNGKIHAVAAPNRNLIVLSLANFQSYKRNK